MTWPLPPLGASSGSCSSGKVASGSWSTPSCCCSSPPTASSRFSTGRRSRSRRRGKRRRESRVRLKVRKLRCALQEERVLRFHACRSSRQTHVSFLPGFSLSIAFRDIAVWAWTGCPLQRHSSMAAERMELAAGSRLFHVDGLPRSLVSA